MAFVTDSGVYPMPVVQDFKRALEHDEGANTGGMGSYSQRDHLLPFLPRAQYERAVELMRRSVAALAAEGLPYRGILYGGFMLTSDGPRLVEFNARFGDPEALNVLSALRGGEFRRAARMASPSVGRSERSSGSVCGRRSSSTSSRRAIRRPPQSGACSPLDEPAIDAKGVRIYFGQVESAGPGRFTMGTSRAIALVGEASAIHEAGEPCRGRALERLGDLPAPPRHRDEGRPLRPDRADASPLRPRREAVAPAAQRRRRPMPPRRAPRPPRRSSRPSQRYQPSNNSLRLGGRRCSARSASVSCAPTRRQGSGGAPPAARPSRWAARRRWVGPTRPPEGSPSSRSEDLDAADDRRAVPEVRQLEGVLGAPPDPRGRRARDPDLRVHQVRP